jgi:hypothetical protein
LDHVESFWTVLDDSRLIWIISDDFGPFQIISDHSILFWSVSVNF